MDEHGASYSPGAMNEGLADYFSSALTGDPDVGEYASQDFAPGSVAIRSLTNGDRCPTAIAGEVHQDATLFSGAIWLVRATLSPAEQALLDEAVFTAMAVAPTGDLSYEEMAQLILAQVESVAGATIAAALNTAFNTSGVLPSCSRILTYAGQPLQGPADLMGLWFGPGTQTTGATNPADGWTPGVVQVHYDVPAETVRLDLGIREVVLGGFGQGTPFAPKFLVRFGAEPIEFTYQPTETTADVLVVDAEKDGVNYSASVDVPPGFVDAHVMVVSAGQLDGLYTDLTITATTDPGMGGAGGGSGDGGSGGTGTGGSAGGGGADDTDDGCSCSVPGEANDVSGSGLLAIGALALLMSRPRRSGRPQES